jgi:hypothetical protein
MFQFILESVNDTYCQHVFNIRKVIDGDVEKISPPTVSAGSHHSWNKFGRTTLK